MAEEGAESAKKARSPKLEKLDMNIALFSILQKAVLFRREYGSTLETGTAWKQLDEEAKNTYERYYEAGLLGQLFPLLISDSRKVVQGLAEDDVEQGQLETVRAAYYRKLRTLSGYYTQMANMDILTGKGEDNPAWRRTCNVTSVSMVLEALGVGTSDFEGDKKLLTKIAGAFEPDTFKSLSDVESLRMPDVLQLVAIYLNFKSTGDLEEDYKSAWKKAKGGFITSSSNFAKMVKVFGVTETSRSKTNWGKIAKKSDPVAYYRDKILTKVGSQLRQGAQVVVNRTEPSKHFVRLEDLGEDGVTIDDPALLGGNAFLSWAEAYAGRYFNTYVVFNK